MHQKGVIVNYFVFESSLQAVGKTFTVLLFTLVSRRTRGQKEMLTKQLDFFGKYSDLTHGLHGILESKAR